MATVKSSWTRRIIPNNGVIAAADWLGAGTLAVNDGTVSVKNDAERLYIALDAFGEAASGPLANDYYWLIVEMGSAAGGTAFIPWPGHAKRLGLWMMKGPNVLPAVRPGAIHRTWTICVELANLGINQNQPPAALKFALRPVFSTPAFTDDSPSNPMRDFADFHQVVLASDEERQSAMACAARVGGHQFGTETLYARAF